MATHAAEQSEAVVCVTQSVVFYFAGEMVLGIYILGIKLWDEGLCFTCLCVSVCVLC